MQRRVRPLWGFGIWGWVLLPVAAALAYCFFGGYDLRLAIMSIWSDALGWRSMWNTTLWGLWVYSASRFGVVVGPVTLISVLVAMFLSPRRWAWWSWWVVAAWLIVNPWVYGEACRNMPRGPAAYLGWGPRGAPDLFGLTLLQLGIFCMFARRVARKRAALTLLVAGAVLGITLSWSDWRFNSGRGVGLPHWVYLTLGSSWHLIVAAVLIGATTRDRRRSLADVWLCESCGYDLRGLKKAAGAAVRCPECGGIAALLV